MKPGLILMVPCLILLAACTTDPVHPQPQVILLEPPAFLLTPCYMPPKRKPLTNRDSVNLYLDLRDAADKCSAAMKELGDWYAKRKLDRPGNGEGLRP